MASVTHTAVQGDTPAGIAQQADVGARPGQQLRIPPGDQI